MHVSDRCLQRVMVRARAVAKLLHGARTALTPLAWQRRARTEAPRSLGRRASTPNRSPLECLARRPKPRRDLPHDTAAATTQTAAQVRHARAN
jgi:hypothetical protein